MTVNGRDSPIRQGRSPRKNLRSSPPSAALTLVSAVTTEGPVLTMQFDRAIDIAAMEVSVIRMDDGVQGFRYVGGGTPILVDPVTVQVELDGVEEYTGPDVLLNVAAGNGIIAAGDGAAWAGVVDLVLPFS